MRFPALVSALTLSVLSAPSVAAPPMEPASRTLFVFVHGINPKSAGAIEGDMDGKGNDFCADRNDLRGRASYVWLWDLKENASDRSIFCSMRNKLFTDSQFSLRAFSNPGETPVALAHELGDRTWSHEKGLRSHVVEAMDRHLQKRLAGARSQSEASRSSFESLLVRLHPAGSALNLRAIFQAMPDSVPSRVVVFAHSMGGLTTREYLASDYFNGDLDKVVTYDTPHRGSWVAQYNQAGLVSPFSPVVEDGVKIGIGMVLLASNSTIVDQLGTIFLVSGTASFASRYGTSFGGWLGNHFIGNEQANEYLTPTNGFLGRMNALPAMPCEKFGCRIPSFYLNSVDGVLAPDDPSKLIGNGVAGYVLPKEGLNAVQAAVMAYGRDWPESMSDEDDKLGVSIVAMSFAFGDWNYTQHGSLPVPLNSSRADGIPFLARPDVRATSRVVDWYGEALAQATSFDVSASRWKSTTKGLSGVIVAMEALTILGNTCSWLRPTTVLGKFGLGAAFGVAFAADIAAYSLFAAKSHNANVWLNATRELTDTVHRPDGTKTVLRFSEAESDLYEKPFVNIASERGVDTTGDSVHFLHISCDSTKTRMPILARKFQDIRYETQGWESRWAVREETHVPVQDSATTVRQVKRLNLPIEILTTDQISDMDLVVDDLRPDLMERMEITLNWGMFRFAWDRERDAQGNVGSTFTFRRYSQGKLDSTKTGVANPIDAYGRWHVDLRGMIRHTLQVLVDGQNMMGISLVNHVGRASGQSQYITFQATPPVVAMRFPQPFQVLSDTAITARFEANLLYYGGIAFDTADAAWSLAPEGTSPDSVPERKIPQLVASDSVQELSLPLGPAFTGGGDGKWNLGLRIQTVADVSKQKGAVAMRRFPFWIDRTAPVFNVSTRPHEAGDAWGFELLWSDLPQGLANTVELVRLRVRSLNDSAVAELPPLEFATGGSRLVLWDGQSRGKPVPDGRYVLDVVGKDGAVPDMETEEAIVALRRELLQAMRDDSTIWTPRRDSLWNVLRSHSRMNWGRGLDTFVLDRSAPRVQPGAIRSAVYKSGETFLLPIRASDAGAGLRNDSVRLRLVLRDSAAKREIATGLVVHPLSPDSAVFMPTHFGEAPSRQSVIPDGNWSISIIASDAEDNRDTVAVPGLLRIDRTPPQFTFVSPTPSYVSSKASKIEGAARIEAPGATSLSATWRSPSGQTYVAIPSGAGDGMWTVTYPDLLRREKGTWVLVLVGRDAAGNETRTSTFVQVDLIPPRLKAPTLISGPVVLKGLAMDPELDTNRFRSYELSWREAGDTTWSVSGMRVPRGRGPDSVPWRSWVEQSAEGVLGFWDPSEASGSVVLRVSVDDGSGNAHEATFEAYVSSSDSAPFSVQLSSQSDTLVAGHEARLGFEILNKGKDLVFDAQATLLDARKALLMVEHRRGLTASALEGRPAAVYSGALQTWKSDGAWHLRAGGACRGYKVILQTFSVDTIALRCPKTWSCRQDTIPAASIAMEGDTLRTNRIVSMTIPAKSLDSARWALSAPSRIQFLPVEGGAVCAAATGCADPNPISPLLPAPGEIRTGRADRPLCGGEASLPLNPGQGSFSRQWDGFRLNGAMPDGDSAILEAAVWDTASGRVVHARLPLPLKSGTLRLGARVLGQSDSGVGPDRKSGAVLAFTVEGRGAAVTTMIVRDSVLVRTLPGSGTWREGRAYSTSYMLDWDGLDDKGVQVPNGNYAFVVEAEGLKAQASLTISGRSWVQDSSLRLSFAPGEAQWSVGLGAWRVSPPAYLQVGTGVEARMNGGVIRYGASYQGTQDVLAFKTLRPSLMVRRKRDRVKYGLVFRVRTLQRRIWAGSIGTDPRYDTTYIAGGVVEMGREEQVHREVSVRVRRGDGMLKAVMQLGPHYVDYVAVPLSVYAGIAPFRQPELDWLKSLDNRLAHGTILFDDVTVTPIYGQGDARSSYKASSFASPPAPPRKCARLRVDSTSDSTFGAREWLLGKCRDSLTDPDIVNPNRNLIWVGTRTLGTRKKNLITSVPSYICHRNESIEDIFDGDDLNAFVVGLDFKIPTEFFDAPVGVDNLANRLLRFDAANKFLYAPTGFLIHDEYDNNGDGVVDDLSEANGVVSPFETRSYQWRPVWDDPTNPVMSGCKKSQIQSIPAFWDGSKWATSPPLVPFRRWLTWKRIGEIAPCNRNSEMFCQNWLLDTAAACSTVAEDAKRSNILQEKLNFQEGDHSLAKDSLLLWFTNTPEQIQAQFVARVRQGDSVWNVRSGDHRTPESPMRLLLSRGISMAAGGSSVVLQSAPVQFTVGVQSNITDFTALALQANLPWPLDSTSWSRERASFEAPCASASPADPSSCQRLYAAASGVRFGLDDSLALVAPNSIYSSSAQEHFFLQRERGYPAHPDALPTGRIPSGSGIANFSAPLGIDAFGRSTHVDSIHFRAPWNGLLGDLRNVRATPIAEDFQIEGPGQAGIVRFTGDSPLRWSLAMDPRLNGRTELVERVTWKAGSLTRVVRLDSLYRLNAHPLRGGADQSAGLFLQSSGGMLAPNSRLVDVHAVHPAVHWRDGSDAATVFLVQEIPSSLGYPEGLLLVRRPLERRLPEWVALRGSIPAGQWYQIGWTAEGHSWRPVGDSVLSSCVSDSVLTGGCDLGLLDMSLLPSFGRVVVRVGKVGVSRFQAIAFAQGTTLPASGSSSARSLFGDASVVFPAGALAGKSEALRTISVRVISAQEAELAPPTGIAVLGPVIEVLPSQSFAGAALPEIVLRLPREALRDQGTERDPASVQLYKIDRTTGSTIPLEAQTRLYLCDGAPCTEERPWTEIEFHGRSSSFSRFALLPITVPDSRSWSISVSPAAGSDPTRTLTLHGGISTNGLALSWDDDPLPGDANDPTPPWGAGIRWTDSTGSIEVPGSGSWWLHAQRPEGGLARSVRVEWLKDRMDFQSFAPDTVFAGIDGSRLEIPYQTDHSGTLRLVVHAAGRDLAWVAGEMSAPGGTWSFPIPSSWSELPNLCATRLQAIDEFGRTVELDGPVLVSDRSRPTASLDAKVVRSRNGWTVQITPSGTDDIGVAGVTLLARGNDGLFLGRWGSLEARTLFVPDSIWTPSSDRRLVLTLAISDRVGNVGHATWSGMLDMPRNTSLLWLHPFGSGAEGWGVEDLGREHLAVRIEGWGSWRDGALAFTSPLERVVTDSVAYHDVTASTLELLGVWDTSGVLLGREGLWELRRDGRDLVFRQGLTEARWTSVFSEHPRWMHLAIVATASEIVAYADGKPLGTKPWLAVPSWSSRRAWQAGGGGATARLGLVRVWEDAFDSATVAQWRAEALGIDSVRWIEAESMQGASGRMVPHCELPSRMAVAVNDSSRTVSVPVVGPSRVRLGARWISDRARFLPVLLDGTLVDSARMGAQYRWSRGITPVVSDTGDLRVAIPAGIHVLSFEIPPGMQLDGLALVWGEGRIERWSPPDMVHPAPVAEVWVRDDGAREWNYLKPRLIVKNTSTRSIAGYRAHLQMRTEGGRNPVVETWWPVPISWNMTHDGHGLYTWSLDRSSTTIAAGRSDFGSDGVALGFHYSDWSAWDRTDDPSCDSSWASGAWVRAKGIPIFSTEGKLLSEWACRDATDLRAPALPPTSALTVSGSSPLAWEGARAVLSLPAEGNWNWTFTVVGITPLDGQPLTGTLSVNGSSSTLAGWWQQITIPNTSHSDLTLNLDLGTTRKVQIQKWHQ